MQTHPRWRAVVTFLGAGLLGACSTPRAQRVPEYRDAQFSRVVVAVSPGLSTRGSVEKLLVEDLTRAGFSAVESTSALRNAASRTTDQNVRRAFEAAGADSVLALTIPSTGEGTWGNLRARLTTLYGETVWTFDDTAGGTNSRDLGAYVRAFCDSLTAAIARERLLQPAIPAPAAGD